MTVLPVAERELRTAARRPGSYWGRLIAAFAAIGIAAWIAYFERYASSAQLGQMLFSILSGLTFLVALFAGVGFTADSISSERREGTLGLLFLTDLRPRDVIAGKLVASSLGAFYGIVAVMPVLAIPLLLGGVTGNEYVRMMFTVLNTLFWSLTAGMFISTFHSESRTTINQAVGLVFAGSALCPATGGILGAWLSNRGVDDEVIRYVAGPLICISPGAAFAGSFDRSYGSEPLLFYASNGVITACSFLFLAVAGRRLPGCWQNASANKPRSRLAGIVDAESTPASVSSGFRTHLLEISPFVWVLCRRWWRRNTPWLFIAATLVAYLLMGAWVGRDWWTPPSFIGLSAFLHLIFKLWISGEAPRQIFEDRKSGAMELLLTAPMTDRDFVGGHIRALKHLFLKPLYAVLVLDLILFLCSMGNSDFGLQDDRTEWITVWLMREWFLAVDAAAITITGFWHGASTRRLKAQGYPFFVVIIVPWLVIAALTTLIYAPGMRQDPMSFQTRLWIWWVIGTAVSLLAAVAYWTRLKHDFRSRASARPGEKKTVIPSA